MIRNAPRRRFLLVVVIMLVGLMTVPIDECDDYSFFHSGAASAQAEGPVDDQAGSGAEDGKRSEHWHVCPCLVCDLTTDDSFAPRLPAPRRGESLVTVPAGFCSSAYLPPIFRPPIA